MKTKTNYEKCDFSNPRLTTGQTSDKTIIDEVMKEFGFKFEDKTIKLMLEKALTLKEADEIKFLENEVIDGLITDKSGFASINTRIFCKRLQELRK